MTTTNTEVTKNVKDKTLKYEKNFPISSQRRCVDCEILNLYWVILLNNIWRLGLAEQKTDRLVGFIGANLNRCLKGRFHDFYCLFDYGMQLFHDTQGKWTCFANVAINFFVNSRCKCYFFCQFRSKYCENLLIAEH